MIPDLKPYHEYRDTGLPWVGTAPSHWKLTPNRAVMRKRKVLVGDRHSEYRLLSLTKAGVIVRDVESGKGKFSTDMGTSQEVRAGDLVFCLFDVPETPRTVGLSAHDGMITGAYTVFECPYPDLRTFLNLFYQVMDDRKLLSPLYSGLRNTIPPPRFLGIKTPTPTTDEQRAIIRFVAYVDTKTNRYIRAKKRLIALLNEQKQAIIHHAVTRGLDANAKLKPSGVEWLGDIPVDWEVKRIKYLLQEVDERSTSGKETLLSMRMYHGLVPFAEHFDRPAQAATLVGFKIVHPGQFVVNRMQAGNGLIFASSVQGLVSPDYAVFSPIGDANVTFLGELFRSWKVRAKFRAESKGLGTGTSGFLRLYNDRLGAIQIALPPKEVQEKIILRLRDDTKTLERAIATAEREAGLVIEYRARLIADVVTGKLDVREAVAKLPESAVDLPVLDEDEELLQDYATAEEMDSEAEDEAA